MEKRFLKGDAAIEHLKADGTLWGICGIKTGDNYWRLENGRFVCGDVDGTDWLLTDVHEREVRTEPPLQADKVADFAHGLKHSSSLYAVGDIVTGDEAYLSHPSHALEPRCRRVAPRRGTQDDHGRGSA
jgi:hypothetical protein